jgi:hypothetical protein
MSKLITAEIKLREREMYIESLPLFRVGKTEYEWHLFLPELQKLNLLIGIVAYDFIHRTICKTSCQQLQAELTALGISHTFVDLSNESCVPRARNTFCAYTLKGTSDGRPYTHFLSPDADIGFDFKDVVKMLAMNLGIVGIPYPKKTINWKKVFLYSVEHQQRLQNLKPEELEEELRPSGAEYVLTEDPEPVKCNGGTSVWYLGDGFIMVSRRALQTMIDEEVVEKQNNCQFTDIGDHYYGFFNEMVHNGEHLTCDYALCTRWRQCGGRVYAYAPGKLDHLGSYVFKGGRAMVK